MFGIGETIGIKVKPSEVRLKKEDDLDYMWQIDDPSLEHLFQKHLSKHSVGAYMQLQREVGKTFRAIRPEREVKRQIELELIASLQAKNLNLTERLRSAENEASYHEASARDAQKEIGNQRSIIQEATMTIDRQQQEISNWIALSEWYQTRSIQCSDALGQLMVFLQGATPENTE
ncbi:uncharacterized protein N7484_000264 [Penicillium longicatenatum]|uniref:uncharacterized protein n=1 Tax=Penicillium longicatenatum TaxID=1561947 RepID=UPI00254837F1|nr:uncharacterized protein N7484_000264 [Penicillium longicatenatum]KAJ5660892.1 hypothetical protein N7484_000264 [Penicillium longicatenatum]